MKFANKNLDQEKLNRAADRLSIYLMLLTFFFTARDQQQCFP